MATLLSYLSIAICLIATISANENDTASVSIVNTQCPSGQDCHIICNSTDSCKDITINCWESEYSCTIECIGHFACFSSIIKSNSYNFTLICYENSYQDSPCNGVSITASFDQTKSNRTRSSANIDCDSDQIFASTAFTPCVGIHVTLQNISQASIYCSKSGICTNAQIETINSNLSMECNTDLSCYALSLLFDYYNQQHSNLYVNNNHLQLQCLNGSKTCEYMMVYALNAKSISMTCSNCLALTLSSPNTTNSTIINCIGQDSCDGLNTIANGYYE